MDDCVKELNSAVSGVGTKLEGESTIHMGGGREIQKSWDVRVSKWSAGTANPNMEVQLIQEKCFFAIVVKSSLLNRINHPGKKGS